MGFEEVKVHYVLALTDFRKSIVLFDEWKVGNTPDDAAILTEIGTSARDASKEIEITRELAEKNARGEGQISRSRTDASSDSGDSGVGAIEGAGFLTFALITLAESVVIGALLGALFGLLPLLFGALKSRGNQGAAALKRCVLLGLIPVGGPLLALISAIVASVTIAQSGDKLDWPGQARRKCPSCAELILREAKVCKHCGRDVLAKTAAPVPVAMWCARCRQDLQARTDCPKCGGDAEHRTQTRGGR